MGLQLAILTGYCPCLRVGSGHLSDRPVHGLVFLPGLFFHCGILLIELKGLRVALVGVQVETQLHQNKLQGLELRQRAAHHLCRVRLDAEGEVQAGEKRTVIQRILLGVALGIGLLEGDIRDRQRGALRHGTAGVSAGIRHIVVGIQTQFLLI